MEKDIEIFKKICPFCGKEIKSLNERQANYNFNLHYQSCKKKSEKKDEI